MRLVGRLHRLDHDVEAVVVDVFERVKVQSEDEHAYLVRVRSHANAEQLLELFESDFALVSLHELVVEVPLAVHLEHHEDVLVLRHKPLTVVRHHSLLDLVFQSYDDFLVVGLVVLPVPFTDQALWLHAHLVRVQHDHFQLKALFDEFVVSLGQQVEAVLVSQHDGLERVHDHAVNHSNLVVDGLVKHSVVHDLTCLVGLRPKQVYAIHVDVSKEPVVEVLLVLFLALVPRLQVVDDLAQERDDVRVVEEDGKE